MFLAPCGLTIFVNTVSQGEGDETVVDRCTTPPRPETPRALSLDNSYTSVDDLLQVRCNFGNQLSP